jgi:hypothetical protein
MSYNYLNRQIIADAPSTPAEKERHERMMDRFVREAEADRARVIPSRHGWQSQITQAHVDACLALLTERRSTNGYADLADLVTATGLTFERGTEQGDAALARAETDLHDALLTRRVVCRERQYRVLA